MNSPASSALWLFNRQRNAYYRLDYLLDRGGEGEVWAGEIQSLGLQVAVKIMHPTANVAQVISSWFHDQNIHLKCLGHPNVVQTYDQFLSPEGYWVLVMERAASNLEALIHTKQPQSPALVCSYGCQILWALHHLHTNGVIHRDITPRNILLFGGGVAKINDFGISKANLQPGDLTRTFLGCKHFLPPELFKLGHWSHQSDIYQVGLVLLSLLIGRHVISPVADDTTIRRMILDGVPRLLTETLIPTYGNLARIIYSMVCRTESLRYNTALAVRRDLWNAVFGNATSYPRKPAIDANPRAKAKPALPWLGSLRGDSSSR